MNGALAAGALALLAVPPAVSAAPTRQAAALLSSEAAYYREAFAGFEEEFGARVPAAVLPARPVPPREGGVRVAFGVKAAQREQSSRGALVVCLAPGVRIASTAGRPVVRVAMMPAPASLLGRLKDIQPGVRRVVVFWSAEAVADAIAALREAGIAAGVVVEAERLAGPDRLPERLRALTAKPDAIWLPPDPVLVTPESFAVLREYAWANGVPIYAPTAGLAEKGAAVSLAAGYREIGRAAARAVRRLLAGDAVSEVVYPERVETVLNLAAAERSGLTLTRSVVAGADRVIP